MDVRREAFRVGTGRPGPLDAITDVSGVRVGHVTLIEGDGPLRVGEGPVRTGVTVVVPHDRIFSEPLFAGAERVNGNGELTGIEWVRQSGLLTTPIALTNTHSAGVVRDALTALQMATAPERIFSLPVVGETFDGFLNDVNGHHVTAEHVHRALEVAASGPVAEGGVGGGTGMICHEFKGGIGTASRVVATRAGGEWTVGALVQANHGVRDRLVIDGVPVGRLVGDRVPFPDPPFGSMPAGTGSIIVIVATDAPLLPHQCAALAKRASFGIARTGGAGEYFSGDFAFAFSTANRPEAGADGVAPVQAVVGDAITPLYHAAVEATEQAIVHALLAGATMTGRDGHTVWGLAPELLAELLARRVRA